MGYFKDLREHIAALDQAGLLVKIDEQKVQLQIADKVRIDVSKAAIGGLQGKPPVVDSPNP